MTFVFMAFGVIYMKYLHVLYRQRSAFKSFLFNCNLLNLDLKLFIAPNCKQHECPPSVE